MSEFLQRLNKSFRDRVWFVGLQGSYGRGEATETSDIDITVGLGYRLANLTTRLDLSHKSTKALIRKVEDGFTQTTSGLKSTSIYFTADYALSKTMTLRAFYERMQHRPTVSSNSYPATNSNAGVSVRLNLNQ